MAFSDAFFLGALRVKVFKRLVFPFIFISVYDFIRLKCEKSSITVGGDKCLRAGSRHQYSEDRIPALSLSSMMS